MSGGSAEKTSLYRLGMRFIDGMAARHEASAAPFEKAGGFAPTMGIIGTVLGLVHVLQNLAAPAALGPSISAAFIATLMGVGSANVIFLPVANRLKAISAEEMELRMMTLEGILSIQAGDNPRLVAEKLMSYLPPIERPDDDEDNVARIDVEARAA
jgi:chemotaxis protein MotA